VTFVPPAWTIGTGHSFRITASQVAGRDSPFACPAKVSLGARKAVSSLQPNDTGSSPWRRTWDSSSVMLFAIRDAFFDVVAGTPIDEAAGRERNLTHAQRRFVIHALHELADLPDQAGMSAGVSLSLDANVEYGGDWGSIRVFGPHLVSEDGSVREVVRLRLKTVKGTGDPGHDDYVAVAARVLANGIHPNRIGSPTRVRVSEFSLHDGRYQVLFDGSPAEAADLYRVREMPVQLALADIRRNPGNGCSDCDFLNVCPDVPKLRGCLGLPRRSIATRALSGTDLAAYDRCPTAFHVQRRDHLPAAPHPDAGNDADARRDRGIAAHQWLRWAHLREPASACVPADLPDPGREVAAARDAAELAGLDFDAYIAAWPYLRHHPAECLLRFNGFGDWIVEPRHVVYDSDADIVVIASPDLTARISGGGLLWRESKTADSVPPDVTLALRRYPAFALFVAVLAAGFDGELRGHGAAELEVLTPTGAHVFAVPMSDGSLVSEAQRVVAEIGHRYAADARFEPAPSQGCRSCDSYGWCLPPETPQIAAPEIDDDEFAGLEDPF